MMFLFILAVLVLIVLIYGAVWIIPSDSRYFVDRSFFDSFECGFTSSMPATPSVVYSFIVIGIFYVIFDLEIALLLGAPYQCEMYFNLTIYVVFILTLTIGYIFEVHNGYVRWSS